jgi:putative PIN family toxin of toxin-antitoxin system
VLRVVIDTSVLVAALRSNRGASFHLLRLVGEGKLAALATTAMLLEYEAVAKRPEQRLVHGLTLDEIDVLLAAFASVLEPVEVHYSFRPLLRDPDDEFIVEAALNGRADATVTFNRRDFEFTAHMGLDILLPSEVIARIHQ